MTNETNKMRRAGGQQTARTDEERQASTQERTEREKKRSTEQQRGKPRDAKKGEGGGNHKGAANGPAGNTKAARAHGKPTRGDQQNKQEGGGGAQKAGEKRGGGEAEKEGRGTQRQGPGHPGPETRESKRQRGRRKKKKRTRGGGGGGASEQTAPRPRAPGAGNKRKQETTGARKGNNGKKQERKQRRQTKNKKGATPARRRPSKAERQSGQREGEAHQKAPGRPARLTRPGRRSTHTHTHGIRAWRPPTCKGRCWRPHETAPVHRPSPRSNDGRYGKPDASVTGSTHANNHSACSPRPTPEGPSRDNPITGPGTGTTRSEPSAPASAGASGRHNESGSRPASACPAQPPSKAGGTSPRGGERHHGVQKVTGAPRATDQTRRGAPTRGHEARQRGTPPATTKAHGQVPSNNGRWLPQTRRARTTLNEPRHENRCQAPPAAVQMDVCKPSSEPSPCRLPNSRCRNGRMRARRPLTLCRLPNSRRPDGRVRARMVPSRCRLRNSRRPDGRVRPPQRSPEHATHSTTHRASTLVKMSQVAEDTAHATQNVERAHRCTGAK